jgi:hypothetical protein
MFVVGFLQSNEKIVISFGKFPAFNFFGVSIEPITKVPAQGAGAAGQA